MKTIKGVATLVMLIGLVASSSGQTKGAKKIGDQVWMIQNLNTDVFRNGDAIPEAKSDQEWQAAGKQGKPAWCYYQNDLTAGKKYGRLYNWYAISDSRGISPPGWRVPSAAEWQALIDAAGGEIAGGALKSRGTSDWQSPNAGATDDSSFSALPGGYRDPKGGFSNMGHYAAFWTATECGPLSAWARHLSRGDSKVYLNGIGKNYGFSVRCIKE
jgi:uncharacterized protein (TIGR02145 family)